MSLINTTRLGCILSQLLIRLVTLATFLLYSKSVMGDVLALLIGLASLG